MPTDRYALALTTSSEAAREAYIAAVDRLLEAGADTIPMFASVAMSISSITVVSTALRLRHARVVEALRFRELLLLLGAHGLNARLLAFDVLLHLLDFAQAVLVAGVL